MKKLTIKDVKKYLEDNDINNDCELLSTEYVNASTPLLLKCKQCDQTFTRNFSNIKRNNNFTCATCARGRRLKIQDVQQFITDNDLKNECQLLSTHYINYTAPLDLKCNICGNTFSRSFQQIKLGNFACFNCLKKRQSGYNRLNIDDVKIFIEKYDKDNDCVLLSTVYINQDTPLLFKCNCCGKKFERTFQTMKSKKAFKCFRCAHHLPSESRSSIYIALQSYFRSKLTEWKNEILKENNKCDISGTEKELEIHHLTSFSSILKQASLNTGIPLIYYPYEYAKYGYSLKILTEEFLRLHKEQAVGVVLTKKYHTLFHKKYGYKNNTPEQYYEFKQHILNSM